MREAIKEVNIQSSSKEVILASKCDSSNFLTKFNFYYILSHVQLFICSIYFIYLFILLINYLSMYRIAGTVAEKPQKLAVDVTKQDTVVHSVSTKTGTNT